MSPYSPHRAQPGNGHAGPAGRLSGHKNHAATPIQKAAQASTTARRINRPFRSTRCDFRKTGTDWLEETQSGMSPALPRVGLKFSDFFLWRTLCEPLSGKSRTMNAIRLLHPCSWFFRALKAVSGVWKTLARRRPALAVGAGFQNKDTAPFRLSLCVGPA